MEILITDEKVTIDGKQKTMIIDLQEGNLSVRMRNESKKESLFTGFHLVLANNSDESILQLVKDWLTEQRSQQNKSI